MKQVLFLPVLVMMILSGCMSPESRGFLEEEKTWRQQRDDQMRRQDSWLTIAGLFWLVEGDNSFGSTNDNLIQLPPGSAPEHAGTFVLNQGRVRVVGLTDALTLHGNPVKDHFLRSDAEGHADELALKDLRLWIIRRGDRLAVRLRDFNAAPYKNYQGLHFFSPRPQFRFKAAFESFDPPRPVSVPTMVGTQSELLAVGRVRFRFRGTDYTLTAFGTGPENESLFIIFRDGTSGMETYGAARFLNASRMEDGSVDLNFNRAVNPPCAYTKYATCPLPPPENILNCRIEAGEMKYDH